MGDPDEEPCCLDAAPPPPPPRFLVPPPPAPSSSVCTQQCTLEPVGSEYVQSTMSSVPLIAVCSSVLLVALLVAGYVFWRHKRKGADLIPCKAATGLAGGSPKGGRGVATTYDDAWVHYHPTRIPPLPGDPPHPLAPIELLDVKYNRPPHLTGSGSLRPHQSFITPVQATQQNQSVVDPGGGQRRNKRRRTGANYPSSTGGYGDCRFSPMDESEGEFEDESSLTGGYRQPCSGSSSILGSTGGDLCGDVISSDGDSSGGDSERQRGLRNLFRRRGGQKPSYSAVPQTATVPSSGGSYRPAIPEDGRPPVKDSRPQHHQTISALYNPHFPPGNNQNDFSSVPRSVGTAPPTWAVFGQHNAPSNNHLPIFDLLGNTRDHMCYDLDPRTDFTTFRPNVSENIYSTIDDDASSANDNSSSHNLDDCPKQCNTAYLDNGPYCDISPNNNPPVNR